ncbi:MAG TPA: DUF3450 family protein [Verrucomicrobiota bacterium]|nr:DUF3450 family protein [Verrucomicrobiota bacterium]
MKCSRALAVVVSLAALVAGAAELSPEARLTETRTLIEQWGQARQLADRTRTDWSSDRALLEQSKVLFERELQAEEERMSRIGTNVVQAGRERVETEQELAAANAALERLGGLVAEFEGRVRALAPLLPDPLRPELQPFLNRLPAEGAATRLSVPERLQTVVGFLNELDKFNGTVVVADEKRPDAAGQLASVEVIYLGLGQAYFVDATGRFAGFGQPGPEGWKWTARPEIGPAVRDAVAMYRNAKPAAFVTLPAAIR